MRTTVSGLSTRPQEAETGLPSAGLRVGDVTGPACVLELLTGMTEFLGKSLWSCFCNAHWKWMWNENTVEVRPLWTCTISRLHVFSDSGKKDTPRQLGEPAGRGQSGHLLLRVPSQKGGRKIWSIYLGNCSQVRKEMGRFENIVRMDTVSKMTGSAHRRQVMSNYNELQTV